MTAASATGRSVRSRSAVVATAFTDATNAGVEMFDQGGNAIDAACAAGLALGVCEPQASGLGGQTLAILHHRGRTIAVDGSSRAPSLAHRASFRRGHRRTGHRATTVPSTVATYGWLNRRYGRLPWHLVVEPARRLAQQGYRITQLQHDLQHRELTRLRDAPGASGARYFLAEGHEPYEPGAVFRQPDLARVLEELEQHGPDAFYQGDIAAQVDADMRANDGFLRHDDLALIPWPVERPTLRRSYRGHPVATMPPPGAGRVLLFTLLMLERLDPAFLRAADSTRHHFVAETFRKAFLERLDRPYDPNTYPQVPDKRLLSRRHAGRLAASIRDTVDPHLPLTDFPDLVDDDDAADVGERGETTHLSAMDGEGNAIAVTQSIELVYGAKVAADGLGFLYNNYLLAFETDDARHPYYLRPNAVPWSTAAPTIVFDGRTPWLTLGSPGSERILSSVAQVILNVIDGAMALDEAIAAPRLHCSVGGKLSLEADRFDADVVDRLADAGYRIDRREPYAFYLGCVQAVAAEREGHGFVGAADPRRDGTAAGS